MCEITSLLFLKINDTCNIIFRFFVFCFAKKNQKKKRKEEKRKLRKKEHLTKKNRTLNGKLCFL